MSSADTFKTVNGGEISLTFTPIMENGEVIDATTMHNYLESLINEATNQSTGELDISKLMKLDQTGLKQFTTETGEQIHNVLMGAFEGEDAELMSGALGALEHYMEEGNMETASQAAKLIQDAVEGAEGAKEELAALIDSANQFHESNPTYAPGKEAYTDTNTKGGTNVTEFKSEGADEVKKDEKDIKDAADKGAEHKTKFTTEGEAQVQQRLNNMEKKGSTSVKVDSDTSSATSGISDVITNAAKTTAKIPVGIDDKATPAARQVVNTINGLGATVKVNFAKTGISTFTISAPTGSISGTISARAQGQNNKIYSGSLPIFGSAARGKFGTIGPKNNGGLTLTGEKGFEIAWLPDENRSTILGVGGPQMINLPSNAVVYTHEQSKEILKRKGIPAGSMDHGSYTPSTTTGNGSDTITYIDDSIGKVIKDTSKKVAHAAEEAAKQVGRISVWWENIARMTEVAQRRQDKNQKAFEKYIKEMRATLKTTGKSLKTGGGGGDAYIKSIGKTSAYYEAQLKKVNTELHYLDKGKNWTSQKTLKQQYGRKNRDNVVQISYEGKNSNNKKTT